MKRRMVEMILLLIGIVLLFLFVIYKNKEFNNCVHTIDLSKSMVHGAIGDDNVKVRLSPRGYDTNEIASWYFTMEGNNEYHGKHYVGMIYELTISNTTPYTVSEWNFELTFPEDLLFAEGWNGDFEMHQYVDTEEKQYVFASSKFVADGLTLDYISGETVLLIPFHAGDYFRYTPSEASMEVPLGPAKSKNKYSDKTIGFIVYADKSQLTDLVPFEKGNITYKLKKSLYREPLFYVAAALFWIWLLILCVMIAVHVRTIKVEKEKQAMEDMVHEFELDDLTKVYTRKAFFHYADLMLNDTDKQYGVAIVSIEDYKLNVNKYGETICNEFQNYLAEYLQKEFDFACIGRFSRTKYALIYDLDDSGAIDAERFINKEMIAKSPMPQQILKVGVYEPVECNVDARRCCDRVSLALAKIQGIYGQDVSYYKDDLETQLLDEHKIKEQMEEALNSDQFKVYYQPKIDSKTKKIIGAEALVRWVHPDYGFMNPGQFIPIFEENGFITRMDTYVFESVCKDIKARQDNNLSVVPVSVNISRKDFFEEGWLKARISFVEKCGINPALIHLEVTESLYAEDKVSINDQINWAKDKGYKIEMDDFGSGYSSLGMLSDMSLDVLKLDISFMKNIEKTDVVVESVIDLAHKLDMTTVAEGVETDSQFEIVKKLGCDYIQGYYFSKPLPKNEFEQFLEKNI